MPVSPDSDSFHLKKTVGLSDAGQGSGTAPKKKMASTPARHSSSAKAQPSKMRPATQSAFSIDVSQQTGGRSIRPSKQSIGSFLTSILLHAVWIVILFLVAWRSPTPPAISLSASIAEIEIEAEVADPNDALNETLDPFESVLDNTETDRSDEIQEMAEVEIDIAQPVVEVAPVVPTTVAEALNEVDPRGAQEIVVGGGLKGRSAQSRAGLAAARGGSPESERAVERALEWIIQHQDPYDGGWRFMQRCGKCRNNGPCLSRSAATGLALMALLGAGYTHQTGPYQEQIENGLKFLIGRQKILDEYGGSFVEPGKGMYHQAIATIALAEAFSLTKDERLKHAVEEAQRYIINAQNPQGGWRYNPGNAGDVLVTGWQVMALKSTDHAGIGTPLSAYERASTFLNSSRKNDGRYKYLPNDKKSQGSPTAVALLSQIYIGMPRDHIDVQRGCDYLLKQGVSKKDIYFDFYTTLVLHHVGHQRWQQWNETMRDYLVRTQEVAGHEAGSWHFREAYGDVGGRLYTTAMAAMTLEVYYRYTPLFAAKANDSHDSQ